MLAHTQTFEEPKYQMYEEFVPTEMKVTKSILPPFEPEKKLYYSAFNNASHGYMVVYGANGQMMTVPLPGTKKQD